MEYGNQHESEQITNFNLNEARIVKNLNGRSSTVDLIETDNKFYILKTAETEDIWNEKDFLKTLKDNKMPSLQVYENPQLKENQLLLEYIPESKGIEWSNPADVEKWGTTVRKMHSITFDKPFKINGENQKEVLEWNLHLKKVLDGAINDQLEVENGLDNILLEKIRDYVYKRLDFRLSNVTLIHGDLHDGNTLIKDGEVVLYDKSSELFAGDPLYDLTIIMTHFPNGTYVNSDNGKDSKDVELLEAFMKGYGEDFVRTQKERLDLYLVIRALDRYPNPFESFNKQIIENIIANQ